MARRRVAGRRVQLPAVPGRAQTPRLVSRPGERLVVANETRGAVPIGRALRGERPALEALLHNHAQRTTTRRLLITTRTSKCAVKIVFLLFQNCAFLIYITRFPLFKKAATFDE